MKRKKIVSILLIIITLFAYIPMVSYADETDWPQPPEIVAESAILVDADTGAVLYEKDADSKRYPASITKIVTAILAIENSELTDTVTFSKTAVNSLPYYAAKLGMNPGEESSLQDCLYALMLYSANEVANALGEHVAGTMEEFADMMTEYAHSVGAVNTKFVNPNGLHDDEHYTTARDYAKITMEVLKNDVFCKVWGTSRYTMAATIKDGTRTFTFKHTMPVSSMADNYRKALGGKTGTTDEAGKTLVTYAKDGDLSLICVVLKSDNDNVYSDSKKILEYGFTNFEKRTVTDLSSELGTDVVSFFTKYDSMFNEKNKIIDYEKTSILVPKGMEIADLDKIVSYPESTGTEDIIADIEFYHDELYLGKTTVYMAGEAETEAVGPSVNDETTVSEEENNTTIIDVKYILYVLAAIGIIIVILIILRLTKRRRMLRRSWRRRQKESRRRRRRF